MAERHLREDEAARYVLGQLPPAEQHEFETHLARSTELRALVQEMEEGVEAIARAVPQRSLPPQAWSPIEQAIAQEAGQKVVTPAIWSSWWRNGWAAAAACLLGWLGYALWSNHSDSPTSQSSVASQTVSHLGTAHPDSLPVEKVAPSGAVNAEQAAHADPAATAREIGVLRWQVAEMSNQMVQLSQSLTQQQALLADSSRIKFFQLTPTFGETNAMPLSPKLQQALFLAMARELGWGPTANETQPAAPGGVMNTAATNRADVDFVDLRPVTNTVASANSATTPANLQTQVVPETSVPSDLPLPASTATNAIPGFVSGTNMVVAVDSSMTPAGSSLAFWTTSASPGGLTYQLIGNSVLGNNVSVVTIPFSTPNYMGWNLAVTATTPFGASNTLGVYSVPATPP